MKLLPFLLLILLSTSIYAAETKDEMNDHTKDTHTKIYYGKVLQIQNARGYKYLEIDENGTKLWVAIANAPVAIGDKIGYDKRTIMHDFESKSLDKRFKEIIFASDVYLPHKPEKPKTMKEMLGLNTQDPHKGMSVGLSLEDDEAPKKPFVKKDSYTVEEVHMWRRNLKDHTISIEGTVFKVSHEIMKLDWVHLGDGTGDEKKLTDDLVFTAASTDIKAGDKVIATGKVVVNKDFGFGYFYKVLIQDATFEVK